MVVAGKVPEEGINIILLVGDDEDDDKDEAGL